MSPELEKLIQNIKEDLQHIAEHSQAEELSDFALLLIDKIRTLYELIEDELKR